MNKQLKTETTQDVSTPSLFPEIPAVSRNFFSKSKPNFSEVPTDTTTCYRKVYNNSLAKNHKKSKPNPNPIQTQFPKWKNSPLTPSTYPLTPNKNMRSKANLTTPKFTANPYSRGAYNDFYPKFQIGTKPNKANIRTISKRHQGILFPPSINDMVGDDAPVRALIWPD
jgi:hypothetical protein